MQTIEMVTGCRELRELLTTRFNIEELHNAMHDFDLDPERIASAKATRDELVAMHF